MSELLPCPFCGQTNTDDMATGLVVEISFMRCLRCGATGPLVGLKSEDEDGFYRAIKLWNQRGGPGE